MNDTSVGPSDATTNITEENTQTSGKIKTLKIIFSKRNANSEEYRI